MLGKSKEIIIVHKCVVLHLVQVHKNGALNGPLFTFTPVGNVDNLKSGDCTGFCIHILPDLVNFETLGPV